MNNNSWNKKEKPLQALSGLGGGIAQPHVYSHKFSATGGTMVTPGNGSTYHIFASNGSFVVEGSGTVEFLVIAGGGSGNNSSGGGGAGGILHHPGREFTTGSYPTSIGAGSYNSHGQGGNTHLYTPWQTYQANGGGGSAMRQPGSPGGSGGGG